MRELVVPSIDQVLGLLRPLPERTKDIHGLRVAIRRLRIRLGVFRDLVGRSRREELDNDLGWLLDQLAAVREWDVVMADLHGRSGENPKALRGAVTDRRQKALRRLHRALARKRALGLRRRLASLRRRLTHADEPFGAPDAQQETLARTQAAVVRRLRKFRDRFERVAGGGDGAALHRLRLQAKKLRYTLEVLALACPDPRVDACLETLVGLQDQLGAEQDALIERERVASLGKAFKMPRRRSVLSSHASPELIAGACRQALRQAGDLRIPG